MACHHCLIACLYSCRGENNRLGKTLKKSVLVSIVGVINYDGAQDELTQILQLMQESTSLYNELALTASVAAGSEPLEPSSAHTRAAAVAPDIPL
jgi:hypothetical protein